MAPLCGHLRKGCSPSPCVAATGRLAARSGRGRGPGKHALGARGPAPADLAQARRRF